MAVATTGGPPRMKSKKSHLFLTGLMIDSSKTLPFQMVQIRLIPPFLHVSALISHSLLSWEGHFGQVGFGHGVAPPAQLMFFPWIEPQSGANHASTALSTR